MTDQGPPQHGISHAEREPLFGEIATLHQQRDELLRQLIECQRENRELRERLEEGRVVNTHSLEEVAAAHLPARWKNPTRWLTDRLNRNELRGIKLSRADWRMSDADIDYMLTKYSNANKVIDLSEHEPSPPLSIVDGLSRGSRRRVGRLS